MAKKPTTPSTPRKSGAEKIEQAASKVDKRVVAGVAGIAVGSAALAAALLFAGRTSKPKSAALDPRPTPPSPEPTGPEPVPSAANIKIQ